MDETIIIVSSDEDTTYLDSGGVPLNKISYEIAMLIVKENTTLIPIAAEEITSPKKFSEYRGRPLTLYKVVAKNKQDKLINVY